MGYGVIVCRVGADITLLREREVDYESDKPRKIAEVLVRKVPDNQQVSARMFDNCGMVYSTGSVYRISAQCSPSCLLRY